MNMKEDQDGGEERGWMGWMGWDLWQLINNRPAARLTAPSPSDTCRAHTRAHTLPHVNLWLVLHVPRQYYFTPTPSLPATLLSTSDLHRTRRSWGWL